MQVVLVCLQPFRCNSFLKRASHAEIAKIQQNSFFGSSRSFKVIDVDKSKNARACYDISMYVPICNRFHTRRANTGKITSFRGYPFWRLHSRGTPSSSGTKFCHKKLVFGATHSEDFAILCVAVLIQCQGVTEGRTGGQADGQTDALTMAKTREALHAVARKNW